MNCYCSDNSTARWYVIATTFTVTLLMDVDDDIHHCQFYAETMPTCFKARAHSLSRFDGWEGTNRVRWPVSKKLVSTKPICLTYVSFPFDVRQEKWLSGHGP